MQFIISYWKEQPEDPDGTGQLTLALSQIQARAASAPGGALPVELQATNHGLGADWPTLAVTISSVATAALFGIPELHKKLRENATEYRHMRDNLLKLIAWLAGPYDVPQYPVELIYRDAVLHLPTGVKLEATTYMGASEFPLADSEFNGTSVKKNYVFAFQYVNELHLVAVNTRREHLWSTRLEQAPRAV